MGFDRGPSDVGFAEKAAKIAIKHGVVYDLKARTFKGYPAAVVRAQAAFDAWQNKQSIKHRQERH